MHTCTGADIHMHVHVNQPVCRLDHIQVQNALAYLYHYIILHHTTSQHARVITVNVL